jgi:hypothetical protein
VAKNQTRRLIPSVVQQDKDAFAALQAISDYAPANTAFTTAKAQSALNNMTAAQQAYAQALAAFESAKDDVIASEWGFHNLMLGAKDQVVAQYGPDSNEVQAIGLKKKSEYKSPKKNGKTVPAPA